MRTKSFVTGLIVGSILTTTISVTAQNQKVEAWLTDSIKLNIEGNDMNLPKDVHVLNYENKIYLPFRFTVEEMGGTIEYDADAARVIIKKPEVASEKELLEEEELNDDEPSEEEVTEKKKEEETSSKKSFEKAPIKLKIQNVTMNVFGMSRGSDETAIYLDLNNDNNSSIMLKYTEAYIELDGTKYPAKSVSENRRWSSSDIEPYAELSDEQLFFETIPKNEKKMEIVIPIEMERYDQNVGYITETKTFSYFIDFNE